MFRHQLMNSMGQKAGKRIKGLDLCGNYETIVFVDCFCFQVLLAQFGSRATVLKTDLVKSTE